MSRICRVLGTVVVLGLSTGMAVAQGAAASGEKEPGRWMLFVGGFFPTAETELQTTDPEMGQSPIVSFEDFGVKEDAESLRLGLSYNFGRSRRHFIEVYYLQVDRDGTYSLDEDFEYGNVIFPVGVDIASSVKTEDLDVHYTYLVSKSDRGALGLSAGVHAIRVDTSVAGRVTIVGGTVLQERVERVDMAFPLPVLGIRGYYDFSNKLRGTTGLKWLKLEVGEYEGGFLDFHARLEYLFTPGFSLGVGWSILDADVDRESSDTETRLTKAGYQYDGPELFLRFRF